MKNKLQYFIIILLFTIMLPFSVSAKEKINLSIDKVELNPNDSATIVVDLDYNSPLYAFMSELSFDENVFEVLKTSNFQEQDSWDDITYNKDSNKFALLNKTGKNKSHLLVIKFIVKENPVAGDTEISFNNPIASDGKKDIEFYDTSISLKINGNGKTDVSYSKTDINENDKIVKTNKPFLIASCVILIISIILLILINSSILKETFIIKKGYKKILNIILAAIIVIFLIISGVLAIINNSKGDINNDGNKDYEDARKINEYLIDIKDETITNKNDLDVNGDGQITITDSAAQEKDTTENTNYKVELTSKSINNYPKKNTNVELNFTAKINPNNVKIQEVYIDSKKYSVELKDNVYSISIKTPNTSGIQKYTITKVILTNGKVVNVKDLTFSIDVLKTEPKIENFFYQNNKITFNLVDTDKSLKSLHIKIVNGKVDEKDIAKTNAIFEKDLDINSKKIELDTKLEYGKSYTILITSSYDLDTNKLDNKSNLYQDKTLYYAPITNGEVTINAVTDFEKLYPNQNEEVNFEFTSIIKPDSMNQTIKSVIINNKEYKVTNKNGKYSINLGASETPGIKSYIINKVILGDNTQVLCNYEIKFDVLKQAPEFIDFMYHEKENKITFTLNDNDKSLTNAKITITKRNDTKVAFEHNLDLNTRNFEFKTNLEKGNIYDVKITGNYDLDSNKDNKKNDFTGNIFNYEISIYDVSLKHSNGDTYYASKGSEVELKFEAKVVPTDEIGVVSKVSMENEHFLPTHYGDGTYGFKLTVPNEAGIKKYKIDKITLDDNKISKELNYNVDVLKDKPSIENFFIDETTDMPIITFDIIDKDNSLKESPGEIIIKYDNKEVEKFNIKKGTNTISLKDISTQLDSGRIYTADIKINYDLDSNNSNGLHEKTEYLIKDHEIKIYKAEIKLDKSNKDYYFNKEETKPIYINATIVPNSNLDIRSFVMEDDEEVLAYKKDDLYYINITAPNEAGEDTYKIKNLILSDDIKIKANLDIKIDVLKDTPYINKVNLNDDNKSISYELVDKDSAFKGGTLTITNKSTSVVSQAVETSKTINYDFKEDETYNVKVIGSYDLDSTEGDTHNVHNNEEMYVHSFVVGGDYNFTLSDVTITDAIKSKEKPVISFTSTNTRGAKVESVTISGKSYKAVNVKDNYYEVTINDANIDFGKHTLTFDSLKLNTVKTYTNKTDFNVNTLSYTVLKDAPSVEKLNLTSNVNDKTITAKYKVKDDNLAITKLLAVLVDSSDKIIDSKEITKEEMLAGETTGVTLSYDKNMDGNYRVKLIADYELSEKYKFNSQNIKEAEIFIENKEIYIDTITLIKSKYVNKNQKNYEISYDVFVGDNIKTINDKKYTRLSAITVNGKNYIPNGESTKRPNIYKGKIGITTPSEAGVYTLSANRVQLELNSYYDKQNNYYSVPKNDIQIEVLKDAPTIENLKIKSENYQNSEVTFEFTVKVDKTAKNGDQSFIDGTVTLGNEEKKIVRGSNTVKFENVDKDKNLDLVFKASYDLDTDTLNKDGEKDENEFTNNEIFKTKYGLYNTNQEEIELTEGMSISKNNDSYFEKDETIKLNFKAVSNLDKLGMDIEKVIIKNKEYNLTKNDSVYEFTYPAYNTFGVKEITISDVVLNNGKTIKLAKPLVIKLEILKDIPKITNFKYEKDGKSIKITSTLKDTDIAIVGSAKVKITASNGKVLVDNENYKNEYTIENDGTASRYYVEITCDYDRDTDTSISSSNYNKDVELLSELISLDSNSIELKDINDINLYKINTNGKEESIDLINKISKTELQNNKDKYFVEINMDNMPSIRAKVKEVKEENNHLILVLDYTYLTLERKDEVNLTVDIGEINEDTVINETHPDTAFEILLKKLSKNENVDLTKNYDASSISNSDKYYVESYSGTLNGNGFTIKNLQKPLFGKLDGATIKNIRFEDVTMPSTDGNGTIASEAKDSTIEGVIVNKYYKANNEGRVGVLLGSATNTTIKSSAAVDFNINAGWANLQQIGGFVGNGTKLTIKDGYAVGKIPGGWNFRSGLVGIANDSTIENTYVKVEIGGGMGQGNVFDIASGNNNNVFRNNISLTTGFKHRPITGYKVSENNYYVDSEENEDINQVGFTKITSKAINKEIFVSLGFSEDIWSLDDVSYDNLPIFKTEKVANLKGTSNKDFDSNKIVLYKNLEKLMPFYKTDKIIEIAKSINDENLNNKEITHIIPVDSKGDIVNYLSSDNVKRINKLKIVFKDNTHKEYKVLYDNTYDMVSSYHIKDLGIDYNYNHYIIDANSQVVNDLTNYLKSLNYTESLDVLTSSSDSRIYKDFYNETTSKELKDFVLKFLSNSNYTNTTNYDGINSYIIKSVKKDNKIEKELYMYNYFRRFYDLEIDGMKLYDLMLFNMEGFDASLTPEKVTELYFAKNENFDTAATGTRYASVLSSYTKQPNIAKFIEYLVTEFGDGDLDKWTKNQFKGYLVEIPIDGAEEEVQYTLWDHFINEDANYKPHRAYDMMLPILTLPKNAAYIISTPVQYVIGAQRSYIEDPENLYQQSIFKRRIKSYADRMSTYYATAYKILRDPKIFNDIHTFHLDKRYAYDENGVMVYQQVGTEEPFHKNFNEVTNRWQTSDGNAAVAWGDRIDWSAEGLMDGYIDKELADELGKPLQEYTYHTFTHETAHNIDARLFLRNNGRRFDAGGEDYADSNLMQSFGPNDIVMNLSVHYDKDAKIGSNLDPSRIDTPEKVQDFYEKVFETIYVMDYIEAQAFLQLSSEDKAEIGIKVTYPNEEKYTEDGNLYRAYQTTGFNQITAEEWDKMTLESVYDLIDNRIMKYAGVYKYASRGSNSYGGEGINTAHWYQPNNPYGRPDSYALKWIAYEMLGYRGYDDGYIEYNSNIHSVKKSIYNDIDNPSKGTTEVNYKSDNMAIETISNGKYKNIDEYKKARFKETEDNLPYLKEINVSEYVQKLYDALVVDAESTRVGLAEKMEKNPNCLSDYWCRADVSSRRGYPESTKVRQEIYYTLKNSTNDFVDEIFADEIQQTIDFTIKK